MNSSIFRIKPGSKVRLDDVHPAGTRGFKGGKSAAQSRMEKLSMKLDALQELMYAGHRHRLLIILQAMDTGGKDGTIRHVFHSVNPLGVRVASFKKPTGEELDHDYLWRIHKQMPGKGEIVIFNRSHYEDVLVVRVHDLVPRETWKKRYDQINTFERMLADEGTTILKFFLHISRDEQKERLQARLDDPSKHWKFNSADLAERKLWGDYMKAYEDVLSMTSTEWAPWHVVPANRKWYRNLVVASTIVDAMKGLKMRYPEAEQGLEKIVIE